MRLKVFKTARSMPGNLQDNYQGSTIWFCGKATFRRRILENLHWQSSTFQKLVTANQKNNLKKPIAISVSINIAPSMTQLTTPPMAKSIVAPIKKRGLRAKSTITITKQIKKS